MVRSFVSVGSQPLSLSTVTRSPFIAAMPPRKRKRQSIAARQPTEEANGGEADGGHTEPTDGEVATDTATEHSTTDAVPEQPAAAAEVRHDGQAELGEAGSAPTDDSQQQRQQRAEEVEQDEDGERDAEGGMNGEDGDEHDEADHNDDADEDGDDQQPAAEADQLAEESTGRSRPMRAVRQKAEEEAAAKKRRRKNRKRRRDGTYMRSDEEDEEEEAEPKQRRSRKSEAAQHDDEDDDEDGGREAQAAVQWVQCELCNKWRKAPASIDTSSLPDQWHCALNTWDEAHASCEAAEEVQQDEETIWPGLPRHFLNSREREDFYFSITRPPFDSAHAPTYPTVQGQPIDLYIVYAYVLMHLPYQTTLDYWAPLAEQLELRPTEKCWKLLRRAYRRHVKAKVESERDVEAADDKDDDTEGPLLIGANDAEAKKKRVYWTEEEDAHLRQAIEQYGTGRWTFIAANVKELGRHSSQEIRNRWRGYTRNRKVKLRVVSDEKLKEMEETESGQAPGRPTDGTAAYAAGKRPYPANVMEMDEHMRYSAVGRKPRVAVVVADEDKEKEVVPAEVVDKPAEGEADKEKVSAVSEEQPLQQFYHKHRHVSVRLSPTVTLPLPVLRRYLCDIVHMKADSVLRLLKDMWDESDETERRRLLSDAVHAQLLVDDKRSAMIGEMDQYCTQTLRKDRRVRWANQLAAYQQSVQAAAAAAATAEATVAAEVASDSAAPSPSPVLESTAVSAVATVAPLQLATPVRVRKQYKLPSAAFASPISAATPVEFTQPVSAAQLATPVASPTPSAVVTPTVPVRFRTYTLPSVMAVGPSAVESPVPLLNPLFPLGAAVDMSSVPPAPDLRSPAALAARIQRPPPLPSSLPSPSSSAAVSPSSLSSPPTSASNRKANPQRGPYFTSRKRVALSTARDAMLALLRTGTLTPASGHTQYIDDRQEWTEYDRAIAEALAPGHVEDFTPAGVRLSAMLRLVDERVLEDQKKRAERRHHVQAARARDSEAEEQSVGTEARDNEEEEVGSQLSLPSSSAAETTREEKEEQLMDTTE